MEKISKEELKKPDLFIAAAETGLSSFEKVKVPVLTLAMAVLVGWLGWIGFNKLQDSKERSAQDLYYGAEKSFLEVKEAFEKAKYQALFPQQAPKDDHAKQPSGDVDKDFGDSLSKMKEVIAKYPTTKAATQAAIMIAQTYADYKKYDLALEVLSPTLKSLSPSDILYGMGHIVAGNVQAAKGECATAIETWNQIFKSAKNEAFYPDVKWKIAVCYQNLKQNDKASEVLKKITEDYPQTSSARMAKTMLRAIDLKK